VGATHTRINNVFKQQRDISFTDQKPYLASDDRAGIKFHKVARHTEHQQPVNVYNCANVSLNGTKVVNYKILRRRSVRKEIWEESDP
jgi:hypothetical protein